MIHIVPPDPYQYPALCFKEGTRFTFTLCFQEKSNAVGVCVCVCPGGAAEGACFARVGAWQPAGHAGQTDLLVHLQTAKLGRPDPSLLPPRDWGGSHHQVGWYTAYMQTNRLVHMLGYTRIPHAHFLEVLQTNMLRIKRSPCVWSLQIHSVPYSKALQRKGKWLLVGASYWDFAASRGAQEGECSVCVLVCMRGWD